MITVGLEKAELEENREVGMGRTEGPRDRATCDGGTVYTQSSASESVEYETRSDECIVARDSGRAGHEDEG